MNMEDFYCDRLHVSFTFSAKDFKKAPFLKASGIKDESKLVDEDGDLLLRFSFTSREEPPKEHGHLRIIVFADKTGVAMLDFHKAGSRALKKKPPYLEEAATWLSGFFKPEELPVTITAAYEFDDEFLPVIPLPFPLVATSKDLSGLKVTGISLQYPPDDPIESVIVQIDTIGRSVTRRPYLFVQKREVPFKLKEFGLYEQLGNLQPFVDTLMRKQEKEHVDTQKPTKARD